MYLAGNYCDSDNSFPDPPLISAQAFIFLSGILSGIGEFRYKDSLDTGLKAGDLQGLVRPFRTIQKGSFTFPGCSCECIPKLYWVPLSGWVRYGLNQYGMYHGRGSTPFKR